MSSYESCLGHRNSSQDAFITGQVIDILERNKNNVKIQTCDCMIEFKDDTFSAVFSNFSVTRKEQNYKRQQVMLSQKAMKKNWFLRRFEIVFFFSFHMFL